MLCKIATFAVLALCFSQGSALKCYSCSSATDSKCADPIDSSVGLQECTPTVFKEASEMLKGAADAVGSLLGKVGIDTNFQAPDADSAFACVKAVKQDGDKRLVIRSCSVPKNDKFDVCTQLKAGGAGAGLVTFCETCESDGCNGASGLASSSLLLALLVALVAFLAKQ